MGTKAPKSNKGALRQLVVKNALKLDNGLRASRSNFKRADHGLDHLGCNSSSADYF